MAPQSSQHWMLLQGSGRSYWAKKPQIFTTPQLFQRKMVETLGGLQGTAIYIANIIVHGRDITEHEEWVQEVTEQLDAAGLKLNTEKFIDLMEELRQLVQVINRNGIWPNPNKASTINKHHLPENTKKL